MKMKKKIWKKSKNFQTEKGIKISAPEMNEPRAKLCLFSSLSYQKYV